MDQFLINLLNGLSSGLLLFMLSSGLTLIFSMMGVLNFAHASFYMLGAYIAYTLVGLLGFWPALLLAPLLVGLIGAGFERMALRRVHKFGHVPELLITFGLSYLILELVQLIWGRTAVPFSPPPELQGPAFTFIQNPASGLSFALGEAGAGVCSAAGVICSKFPLTRAFMMLVALAMLVALWLLLTRTRIGLVIQAALKHPEMVEALGHNVPRVFMLVFGSGCALAALAGVIGGITFVTEPSMAVIVGSIIFVVVVVGGVGSLAGAFVGSILIGLLQTLPLTVDGSLATLFKLGPDTWGYPVLKLSLAQVAPILPYLLMVLILIFRPKGLMGTRDE
ncbi:branched-chain amino acid ABC transporter permease [Paucibacter sp. O1-1]|nr:MULTISPECIES: branched-chain amino acid ABC transporter permease [unclassified Roseateles]MCU7371740.1 branched-chain amino acid ABC transporter permease [Paucibacter sp. O1-1]MCZ7881047.1 branched-chain amino acid ABC transporter permease [Paucibacter sp. M5-1]MDA3826729.1 branched-chain amino acid ABC transporter permease [Paucibacter sp. O1-1]MDC6166348.1 branched-chain amino acid ABC transporter permease [Paucibacter sp. XJ19-41]